MFTITVDFTFSLKSGEDYGGRMLQREGGRDGLREGGNYITVTYDQKQFNNRSS